MRAGDNLSLPRSPGLKTITALGLAVFGCFGCMLGAFGLIGPTPAQPAPTATVIVPTNTATATPTASETAVPPTEVPVPTDTDTPSPTASMTPIPAHTLTHTPTNTPSHTPTQTPTHTPSRTPTNTPTRTPTSTQTPIPVGAISGRVTWFNQPVSGAQITLSDYQKTNLSAISDKAGNFAFGQVRTGAYALSAQSSLGSAPSVSVQVNPNGVTVALLVVPTPIDLKYASFGGAAGWLGTPFIAEALAPDGVGHYRHFQFGSIYWTSQTGAWEVNGRIRDKWSSLGWERSFLGYPLTDETPSTDGIGRYNHFQGGSVFWSPKTDAHEVHGAIRDYYASQGWEHSSFGYPLTDETALPSGYRYNQFQNCSIYWSLSTGAYRSCPIP